MFNIYQLEIPYNFDKKLIDALQIIDPEGLMYHAIYVPPFADDYHSAKRYHINRVHWADMRVLLEQTREEYESHISYIAAAYPGRLMLLLQQPNVIISDEMLEYYINLGFTKFCVNSTAQAKKIKDRWPHFEVICSITRGITKEELESDPELKVFDNFVLPHPFNRDLEAIKQLPKQYQYTLLVNADCSIHCSGQQHWFAKSVDDDTNVKCPKGEFAHSWKDLTRIRPMDLPCFLPYLHTFKLLGREQPSSEIIRNVILYTTRYDFLMNCKADEALYIKD